MSDSLSRVGTLQGKPEYAHTVQTVPSISSVSLSTASSRPLLGRLTASRAKHDELEKDEEVLCGFLKKSTGPWSMAWWADAVPKHRAPRTEPGRGWRPFKVILARGTLYFYKVPSVMIPEIRSTFQIRASMWPTELDEVEAPVASLDDDLPPSALASSDTTSLFHEALVDTVWEQAGKHPELHLVQTGVLPASWTARIEHATGPALAHELVFGTQRVAVHASPYGPVGDASRACDRDERTFLHIVFYALGTSSVPFDAFLKQVHTALLLAERLGAVHTDVGCVRRVSLFLELFLWKRPLLRGGHETLFFREAEALAAELTRLEPGMYVSLTRQFRAWRETYCDTVGAPTDFQHTDAPLVRRAALEPLHVCWSSALFLACDPLEVAQQIQCFHADRLAALVRAPITAYRLASTVSEPLLRSFRFDASRPHWLSHVLLRQILVDDAPERQDGGERAGVVAHWVAVGHAALQLRDMAAWTAIAAVLCSRPVACVECVWRRLDPSVREELAAWTEQLAALGWVEGVHTGLAPRWSVAGAPDVHAVPFLGNAGLTQAATPLLRKARAATRVQIAAQEPEFNRVRALAQRLASLYEDATPVAACAPPIAEWQCLFQRLAQHEYPLHTGITDYLGSAVLASGLADVRACAPRAAWAAGAPLPLFPPPLPAAVPGAMAPGAWPRLFDWLARYEQRGEEVMLGDALRLRAIPEPRSRASIACAEALAAPLGLRRLVSPTASLDALANLARPAEAASQYAVEREPPEYRVLHVVLDWAAFRDAVLLAHHDVLPSASLLDALRLRWDEAEAASREMAWHARSHVPNQYPSWTSGAAYAREPADWSMVAKIRHGVLTTLQRWLALCPHEFVADPVLFEAAHTFLADAAAECDASPADAPRLASLVETLRETYPRLAQHTAAQYAHEPPRALPSAPEGTSAPALAQYLESIVAPLFAGVVERDVARAALLLAHTSAHSWSAASATLHGGGGAPTLARLVRLLPAPHAAGGERAGLLDALPPSLRALCDAYDAIAAWVESYLVDTRIDADARVARMATVLDVVALVRAQMAQKAGGSIDGPIPPTLVEAAVLEGATAPASLAYRTAWEQAGGAASTLLDRVRTRAQELGHTDAALVGSATPDVYWVLAWLAAATLRLPLERTGEMVALSGALAVRDVAHAVHTLRDAPHATPAALARAQARLAWLHEDLASAAWPLPSVHADGLPDSTEAAPVPPRLFAMHVAARAQKRAALAAVVAPAAPRPPPLDGALDTPVLRTPTPEPEPAAPSPSEALLAAVPTTRVASTFACAGALIRVWPFERHPYVFELVLPSSTRCTLKVPDYGAFCQWLARLQAVPHVRVDASFDAGEYAAQVAEHQGRANVAALFQVSLRELHVRTGSALPPAIESLLREVEARGITEQGIYRISGAKQSVDALRKALCTRPVSASALARIDVHVIASTIKLWLRELPEPVVPYAFYHRLLETEEIGDQARRVRAMSHLVRAFPRSHYHALERIATHLATVARSSKVNLMAPHNLGLVFGSTLLSPPPGSGSVAEGFHSLGKAAHLVKILVVMHRHIFPTLGTHGTA